MAEQREDGFLARWSRRKQAARAAEREQNAAEGAAEVPTRPAEAHARERPEPAERPALPDPATLDASSDFSVFLGKDVPVETQRAALRRLWRLDPSYGRVDGLDDYCEDFTDQAALARGLRTAYRVGRGMLERTGEPAAEAPPPSTERAAAASSPDAPPQGADDVPAPVEAAPLQPATAIPPASDDARSIASVPTGNAAGAGTRPKEGTGGHVRSRPVRPLPKRS
jgi:Protein of unknown function (DUF3306)